MADPLKSAVSYTRDFFSLLEEFFGRATGQSAIEFATVDSFSNAVKANATDLAPRGEAAFQWLGQHLSAFYENRAFEIWHSTKQLGGTKFVLGGSSRFLGSQLASVSTSVLYSDTVLVPDPVMPWLEAARTEERFRHVLLLQGVHALLHLKPLVDADLRIPPLVIFPSWEKSLEQHDVTTQENVSRLTTALISFFAAETLESLEEVIAFADRNPDTFCRMVDRHRLFVAPGGSIREPIQEALKRYDSELGTWRSPDWLARYRALPLHRRIISGISERVPPIYHLLENAGEFAGQPLMALEQHAHYFKLVSEASNGRLEQVGALNRRSAALVDALASQRLRWIGTIPASTLALLRRDNENLTFRTRLNLAVARLSETDLGDVSRVAAEVCHDLELAITDHEKELRLIQEKYNRTHGQTLALAIGAAGAALIPALSPFVGSTVAFPLIAKYGYDKLNERAEKRKHARSLFGVLATSKPTT